MVDGPRCGFELVREVSAVDGLVTSEGTVYPLLTRLRKKQLVTTFWRESESGRTRRSYELTDAGREALDFAKKLARFRDSVDGICRNVFERSGRRRRSLRRRSPSPEAEQRPTGKLEVAAMVTLVVPFIGWLFGIAMVLISKAWPNSEKTIGTALALLAVVPFATLAIVDSYSENTSGTLSVILFVLWVIGGLPGARVLPWFARLPVGAVRSASRSSFPGVSSLSISTLAGQGVNTCRNLSPRSACAHISCARSNAAASPNRSRCSASSCRTPSAASTS